MRSKVHMQTMNRIWYAPSAPFAICNQYAINGHDDPSTAGCHATNHAEWHSLRTLRCLNLKLGYNNCKKQIRAACVCGAAHTIWMWVCNLKKKLNIELQIWIWLNMHLVLCVNRQVNTYINLSMDLNLNMDLSLNMIWICIWLSIWIGIWMWVWMWIWILIWI